MPALLNPFPLHSPPEGVTVKEIELWLLQKGGTAFINGVIVFVTDTIKGEEAGQTRGFGVDTVL